MAVAPIEIIPVTQHKSVASEACTIANAVQKEFNYQLIADSDFSRFALLNYDRGQTEEIMDTMQSIREEIGGFHPFLLLICDSFLSGRDYSNLFGSKRARKGLGVLTTHQVADILQTPSPLAYFVYYYARYALSFMATGHKNHPDSRSCVFDAKLRKTDLPTSMKTGALCDECRRGLVDDRGSLTNEQFFALNRLFEKSGSLLDGRERQRPKVFIGSSSEGLDVAKGIARELSDECERNVWDSDVFVLGESFLESLEKACNTHEFGIFVFSSDDEIEIRGVQKKITRDNVIFELGMFVGKLSRLKAFVVHVEDTQLHILTDFSGISKATYDPKIGDLTESLQSACKKIRNAIRQFVA